MNNQYSAKCCQRAWQHIGLPIINHRRDWSFEEDELLLGLVQTYGAHADRWATIALALVSNR